MSAHSLRTDDIAEAQAFARKLFGPTQVVPTRRVPHSVACIDVMRLGRVSVAQVDYGHPVDVVARGSRPRLVLQTVTSGSLQCQGHVAVACPLGATLVYTPDAEFTVSLGERCRRLCVVIEIDAIEDVLRARLQRNSAGTAPLGANTAAAIRWRALVDYLGQELQLRGRSDLPDESHDAVLAQWIIASAALCCNAAADDVGSPALPRALRRAMDFIEAHSKERLGLSQIASHAGVSARTLQLAFARHLGETPMEHVRTVRLGKARSALVAARRRPGAVTRAAISEGFGHLGEFAAAYRRAYGESPSETLERA